MVNVKKQYYRIGRIYLEIYPITSFCLWVCLFNPTFCLKTVDKPTVIIFLKSQLQDPLEGVALKEGLRVSLVSVN